MLLTAVAFGWCLGFTSLVPYFFLLDHEPTKLKIVVSTNLNPNLCTVLLSVTHYTKNITDQKCVLCIVVLFFIFFSFKLFVQKETLLRKLEDNVESEMGDRQKTVERTQRELKEVIIIILSIICSWNDLLSISFQGGKGHTFTIWRAVIFIVKELPLLPLWNNFMLLLQKSLNVD